MQNQTRHLVKPHCFLGSAINWKTGINFPPYSLAKRSQGAPDAPWRPLIHPRPQTTAHPSRHLSVNPLSYWHWFMAQECAFCENMIQEWETIFAQQNFKYRPELLLWAAPRPWIITIFQSLLKFLIFLFDRTTVFCYNASTFIEVIKMIRLKISEKLKLAREGILYFTNSQKWKICQN